MGPPASSPSQEFSRRLTSLSTAAAAQPALARVPGLTLPATPATVDAAATLPAVDPASAPATATLAVTLGPHASPYASLLALAEKVSERHLPPDDDGGSLDPGGAARLLRRGGVLLKWSALGPAPFFFWVDSRGPGR